MTEGSTAAQPDDPENAKLDIVMEVIAENLGKSLRKLGLRLGLTDVKLESIFRRHPTELDETTVNLLKEWQDRLTPSPKEVLLAQKVDSEREAEVGPEIPTVMVMAPPVLAQLMLEQETQLLEVFKEVPSLFSASLGKTTLVEHIIHLKIGHPIPQWP